MTSLVTRLSQLMFFISVCGFMRLTSFAAHARALGAVSHAGVAGMFAPQIAALPALGWDVAHLVTDGWMLALQAVMLFVTLGVNVADGAGAQIYTSYDLQCVCMYTLVTVLYAMAGAQFHQHAVEAASHTLCCVRGSEAALATVARRASKADGTRQALLDRSGIARVDSSRIERHDSSEPAYRRAGGRQRSRVEEQITAAEVRAKNAYARYAWMHYIAAAVFGLRAVLFAWKPVSGVSLSGVASTATYPLFFYTVPEAGITTMLLASLLPAGVTSVLLCTGCRRCFRRCCACTRATVGACRPCARRVQACVLHCTHTETGLPRCTCSFNNGRCRCRIRR